VRGSAPPGAKDRHLIMESQAKACVAVVLRPASPASGQTPTDPGFTCERTVAYSDKHLD